MAVFSIKLFIKTDSRLDLAGVCLPLLSLMVNYVGCFSDVEPALQSLDKLHLV